LYEPIRRTFGIIFKAEKEGSLQTTTENKTVQNNTAPFGQL
jgi:hypothetical protein